MPAVIGTAVPHDHLGNRLTVHIGNTFIDGGGPAPLPYVAGYPDNYWAELVRSSSSTALVEASLGQFAWLRTSDGEPLEQERMAASGRWFSVSDDTGEPDFVVRIGSTIHTYRFRKAGAQWIPSDAGIAINDINWNGQITHRFFTNGVAPAVDSYSVARTIDRVFGNTPASGGGNVTPDTFVRNGATWQVWQVIPFIGTSVASNTGDCRLHLRDTSKSVAANQLADMPDRITLSSEDGQTADWTGLPWQFTRPTSNAKFGTAGNNRRSIDYEPVRDVSGQSPSQAGLSSTNHSFTLTLEWD